MTRPFAIPRGPFVDGDDLANVGNALMVLHFFVLGHEDSWGSCATCHAIVDQACPEYTGLRRRHQRADGDSAAVATTRWLDEVRTMNDRDLFPRLVHHPSVPLRTAHPLRLAATAEGSFHYLIGSDVAVIEAAIARGRGVLDLHDFVCRPGAKDSAHDRGTTEHPSPCQTCRMLAIWVARTIDKRARRPAKGESLPKGRLKAIAQFTQYRVNLKKVALDSYDTERTDMGVGMTSDPNGYLPKSILRPIEVHPDRSQGMETYQLLIKAMKRFATDISPHARPTTQVPYRRIGEEVIGLSEQETIKAWHFIEAACDADPKATEALDEHVRNHLDRRLSGAPLLVPGRHGGPVHQSRAVTQAHAANAGSSSLCAEVIASIESSSRPTSMPVQRHEIEDRLFLALVERAPHLFDRETDDLSDASRHGDPAQVARLDGFQDLVDEISDYFNGRD